MVGINLYNAMYSSSNVRTSKIGTLLFFVLPLKKFTMT
jgi:hypothetical protein